MVQETSDHKARPSWILISPSQVEETPASEAASQHATTTPGEWQTTMDFDMEAIFGPGFELGLSPSMPQGTPLLQRTPRRTPRGNPKGTPRDTTLITSDSNRAQEPGTNTPLYQLHERNNDKPLSWELSPSRPILIIGESNMSRLPSIPDARIQVDCYPGANLNHARHLLRNNTPTSPTTAKVILSFGLNNRRQSNPAQLKKDLHGMLEAAKVTFPQAEIFIPIINLTDSPVQ